MTSKTVLTRNTISGKVGSVPASYLTHPVFKDQFVVVEEGAKDYIPELYASKTADEFESKKTGKASKLITSDFVDEDTQPLNESEAK